VLKLINNLTTEEEVELKDILLIDEKYDDDETNSETELSNIFENEEGS
jgi:hypothetical protein